MNRRLRSKFRVLLIIGLCAGLGGVFYGLIVATNSATDEPVNYQISIARGLWTGLTIALPIGAWEIFYVNGPRGLWLRSLPFAAHLGIRTLVYLTFIVLCLWSAVTLFGDESEAFGLNATTLTQLGFSFIAALVANFAMSLNRLLGQSVFLNFLTGRYHKPKIEHRVMLFADLSGSTALAEQIGDRNFHLFLNEIYRVLTGPVIEHRGTVHKYVGDEMIVSWRDRAGRRQAALQCGIAMQEAVAAAGPDFERTFGHAPRIRCGIHVGPIVAGEMGDIRQEIVYLGDAMNVTARLVDACRTLNTGLLVSNAVLETVETSEFATVEAMGDLPIRGRQHSLPVSTLARKQTS